MEKSAQTPPTLDNWQPTDIKKEENPPTAPKTQARSSFRGKLEEDYTKRNEQGGITIVFLYVDDLILWVIYQLTCSNQL
jgi:hypothetical protein